MHMKNRSVFSGIQMNWFAVLAGVFCLTVAAGVSAAQTAKPCADDAAKLCKDVSGQGKIAKCLNEHSNDLSPACKEHIEKAKAKIQHVTQACKEDAAKLCKSVPGGGKRAGVAKCLNEHINDLSPACRETIEKAKKKVQHVKEACKEDAAKLCKGTKPGGGKIVQCLKQHEGELSAACKEAMPQPTGKM
jgi:hypothetical protein